MDALLPQDVSLGGAETHEARPPRDMGQRIDGAIAACDGWFAGLRAYVVGQGIPPDVSLLILGLGARFRTSLALLRCAFDKGAQLSLHEYLVDVSL